jgi:Amt family ammonium transporter
MINNADTAWVLVSSALVMLMTPGLAFFYAGLAPGRNALNTLKMSFACLAIVPLAWFLFGYSFAFASGTPFIGGLEYLALQGVGTAVSEGSTIPDFAFMVFQMMFAIITPALISGALVGRMKYKPYVLFVILWSLFVYSPVAHLVWGPDGWLAELGAIDFAGGTVVHINAGFAALVAAYILGPRANTSNSDTSAHNIPFVLLGAGLLWFGWFGFNAGSSLAADGLATLAFVTTILAAAASMATWTSLNWIRGKPSSATGSAIAAVIGLVTITPAAGFVTPGSAIIIGIIGCVVSYSILEFHLMPAKVDDTLDVFACHGVAGLTGCILTGVFATTSVNAGGADGLLYGNPGLLVNQIIAVLVSVGITVVGTTIILLAIKTIMPIRHTAEEEEIGIDIIEHGESAYEKK